MDPAGNHVRPLGDVVPADIKDAACNTGTAHSAPANTGMDLSISKRLGVLTVVP